MSKPKPDPDIDCLRKCIDALNKSSSQKMLRDNMEFLNDRFLRNPTDLPEHLRETSTETNQPKP